MREGSCVSRLGVTGHRTVAGCSLVPGLGERPRRESPPVSPAGLQEPTLAADFGCVAVVVDAKPEAVAFYGRYGFSEFGVVAGELGDRPAPRTLFLELGAIPKPDASPPT